MLGEAIGNKFAGGLGGKALGNAGSWLARLFGQGSYSVKKNSLIPGRVETAPEIAAPPVFGSIGKGADVVFSHREFVGDVKSSVGFATTVYPINPGNPNLFPWASQIAKLYEEYEALGIVLEYRPTSATAVGTTSAGMGVVIMATDYDVYDRNYTSKRAMEAAEFSSAGVPYDRFIHPIECDPARNVMRSMYIVPGITDASQASGDERMSVLGNLTIATVGQQTTGDVIGELWISYHIRLSRPILEDTIAPSTEFCQEVTGTATNIAINKLKVYTSNLAALNVTTQGKGNQGRINVDGFPRSGRYQCMLKCQSADLGVAWYPPVNQGLLYGYGVTVANWTDGTGVAYAGSGREVGIGWSGTNCWALTVVVDVVVGQSAAYINFPFYCPTTGASVNWSLIVNAEPVMVPYVPPAVSVRKAIFVNHSSVSTDSAAGAAAAASLNTSAAAAACAAAGDPWEEELTLTDDTKDNDPEVVAALAVLHRKQYGVNAAKGKS